MTEIVNCTQEGCHNDGYYYEENNTDNPVICKFCHDTPNSKFHRNQLEIRLQGNTRYSSNSKRYFRK